MPAVLYTPPYLGNAPSYLYTGRGIYSARYISNNPSMIPNLPAKYNATPIQVALHINSLTALGKLPIAKKITTPMRIKCSGSMFSIMLYL